MIECDAIIADKVLIYINIQAEGQELNPEEHQSVQEQKHNNDLIARHSVYGQSDKMITIEGQQQQIQSQYGDGVYG